MLFNTFLTIAATLMYTFYFTTFANEIQGKGKKSKSHTLRALAISFPPPSKGEEMPFVHVSSKSLLYSSPMKNILLLSSFLCIIYLFVSISVILSTESNHLWPSPVYTSSQTSLNHVVFGIAATIKSWPKRKEYVQMWWKPNQMRGCVFLESMPVSSRKDNDTLPPICISEDTSRFRYTFKHGYRSAIRVARVVLETVRLNHTDVRWFVFGDDDTLFFVENLVKTLSKYDHDQWYYIGSNSENFMQNGLFSFDMAFGGAGFAISYSLAKALAKVFDSCLDRYPHLYGSDARISSCLAELGIVLTHEPGFHQVDVRGDLFGLLASHPLSPLVTLHHMDVIEPIFPNKTTNQALEHLFKAVKFDPQRILQQSICYDQWLSLTISISWGYAVQLFDGNIRLPNVLPVQHTFKPWDRKETPYTNLHMFNTYDLHPDLCKRPTVYFLENLSSTTTTGGGIESIYRRNISENCLPVKGSSKKIEQIRVFSKKLDLDIRQLQAPRRQCCDVLRSSIGKKLDIAIRECGGEETMFMHP